MGAASNHGNALEEKITGISKIQQKQQIMEFGLDILISLDATPTAWYNKRRFTARLEIPDTNLPFLVTVNQVYLVQGQNYKHALPKLTQRQV